MCYPILCWIVLFPIFVTCTAPWFIKYVPSNSLCEDEGFAYIIPLFYESSGNYSICTTYFSENIALRITLDLNPLSFFVEEFSNSTECLSVKRNLSNSFSFDVCNTNKPGMIFQNSFFYLLQEEPEYARYLINQNEYLRRTTYEGSDCNGEYSYIEVMSTKHEFGDRNEIFRCNDSVLSISLPHQKTGSSISKIENLEKSKCYDHGEGNILRKYECLDHSYFQGKEEELDEDQFMIINIYNGKGCKESIKWQDIIRNGLCFPLENEYQRNLFKNLIHDSLEIIFLHEYSVRELYRGDSNTLFFEIFNNSNCESQPFFGRIFHPHCNDFKVGDGMQLSEQTFSDFKKESLLREKGRVTIFQTENCHISKEVNLFMKDIVLNKNFDFITSVSPESCYNSYFEFYVGDNHTSMYGSCSSNNEALFELYSESDSCDLTSSKSYGSLCLSATNHGSSAWYSCVPFFCFSYSQFEDEVCNGRGECVGDDVCSCNKGWYVGRECQLSGWVILSPVFGIVGLCLLYCCCGIVFCFSLFSLSLFFIIFVLGIILSLMTCGLIADEKKLKKKDFYHKYNYRGTRRYSPPKNKSLFSTPLLENGNDHSSEEERFVGDKNGIGRILKSVYIRKRKKEEYLIFDGNFKNGMKEGKGREFFLPVFSHYSNLRGQNVASNSLRRMSGQRIIKFEGVYKNNLRHGPGLEYSIVNEKTLRGVWDKGEIVNISGDYINIPKFKVEDFKFDFIRDKLGSGSGGDVFGVNYDDKPAALKILRNPALVMDEKEKVIQFQRFARSVKIWTKVSNHPYILELYAWTGLEEKTLGYISERCRRSLHEAIVEGSLDWKAKVRLLYEIASGMEYLHSLSIMHRDLKIGNILLDELGNAKICDFDFSRHDDIVWKNVSTVSVLGTPTYVAPEVMKGNVYSKKCDIYSYGILAYCLYFDVINPFWDTQRCVCGKNIRNERSLIHIHVSECGLKPYIDPKRVVEHEWIIHDLVIPCLSHDPEERPKFRDLNGLFKKNRFKNKENDDEEKKKKLKVNLDYTEMIEVETSENFLLN